MSRQYFRQLVLIITACLLFSGQTSVLADNLFLDPAEVDRKNFRKAESALKARQYGQYYKILQKLDGYVLKNYLTYRYLKKRIAITPEVVLQQFIDENKHTPLSLRLQENWLHYLAGKKDWANFLAVYDNNIRSKKINCYRLKHLIKSSYEQAPLMSEVEELWLTGKRLPSACNPVFRAWQKAGHMTDDLIWARIKLAMDKRSISLARSLGRLLPRRERVWVRRWESVHWNPARELRRISFPIETPVARNIVKHGIVRLGYRDPEAAMAQWLALSKKFRFFPEDENYVFRMLGVLAAQSHLPVALDWLARVAATPDDDNLRVWQINASLRAGEWHTARHYLSALPDRLKKENQWQYWLARVEEESGHWKLAQPIYAKLSRIRSYYGFLAADRLDLGYDMQHKKIEAAHGEAQALAARPGIKAAKELYYLGKIVDARRQWNFLIRKMNNRELQIAAVVAREWGWYDRAIYTVNRSDHLDDLDLRFPVLHRNLVQANADRTGIDPEWIYGVMRQESAFVADARSPAGALGLMQLMPRTGRQVGRKLKMRIRSNSTILKIENNLKLGSSYLKTVLDRKQGSQVLATASYNAGPHRVKKWMPDNQILPADIWVDTIPFKETRNYVKNVLGYTAVYEHRLGVKPSRLFDRMPSVKPDE
jgi:soluble lytic murein transglycosylase